MVRWIRLWGNQWVGFWLLGFLLFVVQGIPYMVMPLWKLETNPIMNMPESSLLLEKCEKLLGSLCIALMMFVVHGEATFFSLRPGKEQLFFCIAMGILLMNFVGWLLYFSGHQSLLVMMLFIVVLPPLYYVFIGLWRSNLPLTVTGYAFLIIHSVHVWGNLNLAAM